MLSLLEDHCGKIFSAENEPLANHHSIGREKIMKVTASIVTALAMAVGGHASAAGSSTTTQRALQDNYNQYNGYQNQQYNQNQQFENFEEYMQYKLSTSIFSYTGCSTGTLTR